MTNIQGATAENEDLLLKELRNRQIANYSKNKVNR